MIEHLTHEELDREDWDARLLRSPFAKWYAQSWVLDIASPGWEALVDRSRDVQMPLTIRRKYGVRYLFQPYALQQLGMFGPGPVRSDLAKTFLHAIPGSIRHMDIWLNSGVELDPTPKMEVIERTDQLISLDRSAGTVRSNYSKNHLRNLKKAEACASLYTEHVPAEEFLRLFEQTTVKRFEPVKSRELEMLGKLLKATEERNELRTIGIREGADLRAAVVLIEWGKNAILLKTANSERGKDLSAMFYLYDRYITDRCGSLRTLDLAGSMTPSVNRFNSGFGAQPALYLQVRWDRTWHPLNWFRRSLPWPM